MNVELTKDVNVIKGVILSLWDTIAPDGSSKEDLDKLIVESLSEDFYFKVEVEKEIVGMVHFNKVGSGAYEVHMNMLPGARGSFAYIAGTDALLKLKEVTDLKVLQAVVPDLFPNIKKFAEGYGMTPVKRLEDTWDKNGIKYAGTLYQLELN